MPRVLLVSTSTTIGGAEKTLYALATHLDPRFNIAGVVSLKNPGSYAGLIREAGVPVHSLGLEGFPGPRHARALAELLERERPDLVHALMFSAIQLCRWLKIRRGGFRLVSSPRVTYRTRSTTTLLLDRALRGADDLLVSECRASRDFLVGTLGYDPAKVRVVRNGVEAPAEGSQEGRMTRRAELGLAAGEVLLGAIGRLDRQKGHAVLLEALARLHGPWRCVIAGEGPDRSRLEARARALGLGGRVRFLGEVRDPGLWLSSLDVFVLPSLWEGLPNALLEAMARGLACVASAVDGVPEALTDGADGLTVPPSDVEALARALERLARDPSLRARLSQAARRTASERFGVPAMLAGHERAYSDALA